MPGIDHLKSPDSMNNMWNGQCLLQMKEASLVTVNKNVAQTELSNGISDLSEAEIPVMHLAIQIMWNRSLWL